MSHTKGTAKILDELQQQLADYQEGCEGLKLAIQDLRQQREVLLKACKGLLGAMPPALQKKWPNNVERAKQAIAKAEEIK